MKLAIDFDDTISTNPKGFRELITRLIEEGNQVVIWSQRAARSEPGRSRDMEEMERLLKEWKIPYTEIDQHGKVWADLYIDDRAISYDKKDPLSLYKVEQQIRDMGEARLELL